MILFVYSTTDGHTRRICEYLATELRAGTDAVTLAAVEETPPAALERADTIVVGASVRYGRHRRALREYVAANAAALAARPSAFFSVNLTARKSGKDRPDTNPYVRTFLARSPWRPGLVDVFAGKLDYPRYGWLDRQIIRLIMRLTGGPTDPRTVIEYTDWARVLAFGKAVARLRSPAPR